MLVEKPREKLLYRAVGRVGAKSADEYKVPPIFDCAVLIESSCDDVQGVDIDSAGVACHKSGCYNIVIIITFFKQICVHTI